MAIRCESDRDIPCQRPGCRDILPNMRSLASHLAMHDIEPAERCVRNAASLMAGILISAIGTVRVLATSHSSILAIPWLDANGSVMHHLLFLMPGPYGSAVSTRRILLHPSIMLTSAQARCASISPCLLAIASAVSRETMTSNTDSILRMQSGAI